MEEKQPQEGGRCRSRSICYTQHDFDHGTFADEDPTGAHVKHACACIVI